MNQHTPVTETELKAKAVAPRVTSEALDANIKSVTFLNAGVAAAQAYGSTPEALTLLTFCVIELQNGFTVTGESACASPENFNEDIGRRIAFENAKAKIWPLMGYALKERLHRDQALLAAMAFEPHPGVETFIGTKVVNALPMTRGAYNKLRGWLLPADEEGEDSGYLVEYTDRVDNHVAGFQGYVSWSPKDVFERAYRRIR